MKKIAFVLAALAAAACSQPKQVFVPKDLQDMDLQDTASLYCLQRSVSTDDIIVLWEKGFGPDVSKAPDYKGNNMTPDLDNLLSRAQSFYEFYRDRMHFILPGSKADSLKMMIMLKYDDEGTAYGGDYDGTIGALWVTPLRTRDERMNCIAHELGHSFQSQLSIDSGSGFGGGGIYEMTSQWMLWNVNPLWVDDETYHWNAFMPLTHLAFMHPDNMYRSPYVLEYWSEKRGLDFIADLWRAAEGKHDVVEVYEEFTGMDEEAFGAEIYDCYAHMMAYDLPRVREVMKPYANRHSSTLQPADADGWMAVASDRVPQQYGYNGIELPLPADGALTLTLKGGDGYMDPERPRPEFDFGEPDGVDHSVGIELVEDEDAPDFPKVELPSREALTAAYSEDAAWTFGLVAVAPDGGCTYSPAAKSTLAAPASLEFTVPDGTEHLWLVVTPTPAHHCDVAEWATDNLLYYPYSVKIN